MTLEAISAIYFAIYIAFLMLYAMSYLNEFYHKEKCEAYIAGKFN